MPIIKMGLLGYPGRMGQLIASEIENDKRCRLVAVLVRAPKTGAQKKNRLFISDDAEEIVTRSDVVLDFTSAEATKGFVDLCVKHRKAFISGTTGLDEQVIEHLKKAGKKIPVLYAANTSLSLAAMRQLTLLAARLLSNFAYDVSIVDEHHQYKKDAPSGTAKVLGHAVSEGSAGKKMPIYVAVRAGEIVGEHEVIFSGEGETIRLHHSVQDRRIFAQGAKDAALWLATRPKGFYSMDDVLGLKSQH